jgi:hypothetical protein
LWVHDVKRHFDQQIRHPSVAVNLVKPGRYIPPHKDLFYRLLKNAPIEVTEQNLEPVRINIFLQDWQLGHIFEMNGETWMGYNKGDYTVIHKGVPHSVVNIGYHPRYTLQISGFAERGLFT